MITQHSFSIVPEGHSLRRRYTVTANRLGEEKWQVRCDGLYVNSNIELTEVDWWYDEQTALAIAERAASELRVWTQYGEMNAQEAMEAGLR